MAATEAEIIQEPISVVKTEEESKHLSLELSDKAVEFLPGDLKKFQGLAKAENMEVASNKGVETMNTTVFEENPEMSKVESFLISPEISKVSNETSGMSETPFEAEKIPEDEEKMAKIEVISDQDSSLEEKRGSIDEGTKTDENADIESNKQEANLELKKQASIDTLDPIIDSLKEANETVTEASNSNLVQEELTRKSFEEVKDTKPEKLPALVGKEEGTEAIDPIETSGNEKDQIIPDSFGYTLTSTVAETNSEISEVTKKELRNENPYEEIGCVQESAAEVDEKLEEVSSIIIKDTSQATIESSEINEKTDQDLKKDEESIVPMPEGSISEIENIDVVQQSQEGKSKKEEILKESFEQQNEPEKEKPACPLNAVYKDVNTAETSTSIKEVTSVKDHEERFEGEGMEDTPNNTEAVSKDGESKEKDLQIEVNKKTETVEVEISNKNVDDLQVTDSLVGESVEKEDEKRYEFSDVHPEEQVREAIGASKEKQEHSEDVLDSEKCSKSNEALESKQEKPELKDAMENIEDNLKQEETKEICEGSKSILNEECTIIDDSPKSTEEERNKSFQEDEKEETPEVEVCKESETAASGTGKENPEMEEHPIADISNSSISDETMKESIKEDESSPMKLTEKASDSNIEETPTEVKEDLVRSSSFELEESKKDTADLETALTAAETEETNIKEAEAEEKKQETNNVLSIEDNSLATTAHEGIGVDIADIDVKPAESSISCEKDKEISREEDGVQDNVPNAESEDQMEKTTREIPLKEILGDEVKEHYTLPLEENEPTPTEETKITDEISEKDQAPYEHSSETPVPQATDEILMKKEDNPTIDVPKVEPEETGHEHLAEESHVHTEQETGKCIFVSEVTNVSKGEDEQSSDLGLEREKIEDGKPLDEAKDLGETSSTCKDGEKAIQEEDNLAKNLAKLENLKEDTEVEKEETELPRGAHDNAKNVELALASFEEKPKSDSEPVAEDQSKEKFPEPSKIQADETITDVQTQENEEQIKEEQEDKLEDEDYINSEQNANVVTKAVILSEEVDKEVEKADDREDIEEHVMEEESSRNELHPESKGDETTNEVEDYSSVSTECLKEADSKEQVEAKTSEVEEHSTKDREASLVIEESEEKIKEDVVVDESKLRQDESDEAVTNSVKMSLETSESDANQETKEVENVQLEEICSDLAPHVPNDNDEVENQSLNVEIVDKDVDPDAVYMSKDQIDEAEKSLTVEKVHHELVETKSEASKTSNVDEPGKIELASDGDHVSEDKGIEQVAETKKSLTAEELEANEVKQSKAVPETSSDYLSERVETTVEDDIGSHSTLPEEKPDEQLQTSASTLPSEDEEIRTAHSIEKIEEEDSSDTKKIEEVCLQKEEEREPKAVSLEETIVDQGLQKEEQKEQTLAANKPEEGTTSSALLSKEQEEETISTFDKIDEEKIIEPEISEDFSDAKQTAEICLEKEEVQELEDGKKDETVAAQAIQVEEPKVQSLAPALPSENIEHETTANEEEEEKAKEVEMLERERPQEPEAVVDQETTVAQASITEESLEIETVRTVEKLEEEERKEAEKLEDEHFEDSSAIETEEISLQKEEPNELHAVPKEDIISDQTSSDEQLHTLTSATISEELEHETKKTEDEKTIEEEIIKDEIPKDASDARTMEEICSQKEKSIELVEAVVEDEMTADHTLTEKKPEEQVQNPTSTLPSKEDECGSTSTTEKIESAKIEEAEFLQDDNGEDVSLQKERLQEDEDASSQTLTTEKSKEQIPDPVVTLPSDEHMQETVDEVDKTEEEKAKEEEMQNEDSYGAKIVEEAETMEDDKSPQSECVRELKSALEDGATTAQTLPGEKPADQLHKTKETELQEDESLEKTREVEEASNVNIETREKAFDNELLIESEAAAIKEKLVKERDDKTNEIILNEVSKEEVLEDKEVTETSYSTSHPEELTKDGSGEDELKDKLIEEEALETTQNEEIVVEAQKSSENEKIEKQIVCEDKTVEDPGQAASVARIETATVTEEESSVELSQADSEGTKDHAEGNEILDDIQQPEETTNIASDNQIPRELDPIEKTEITSSTGKEHVPIDSQDRVAESSQKAEVEDVKEIYPKEAEIGHGGEKITDNSGQEITKESISVEDSTKVSSSDHIESSTKETLKVTQDMIKEREAKDETGTAQILLVEKPVEQSQAPSSKLPSEEGEHGVTSRVDAVEEKELKEVEALDKDSSDTKTGSQICLEKGKKEELKAVVEQETIDVQAPATEIKEDLVSHFEDGSKEDELKDEHTGDKTNETLKIPTYEIQNEKLSVETLKDGANNNVEKEITAEDKNVKDLEQASVGMKEATIVREEIPGEADPVESRTTSSIGKEDFPTEQQVRASETMEKPEVGDLEPGKAQEICSEAGVDHGEEKTDNSGVEITQETALADSGNLSLSDLLQRSTRENIQVAERVIEERELTVSKEEAETIKDKEAKTDEEKDGEEGDEHHKADSGSDAPVMVEAPRETETKPHKKSQNILSGVGSKVKHSISKVKKAIIGKSSHSKEPKPISPKGS